MSDKNLAILYVDDEPHNLHAFKAAFRREYSVSTALGGEEALQVLREKEIHLVIVDQRMPGMTGAELLEKVRHEFPEPVRMVLTGYSDLGAVIKAINDGGVFRYVTKPWDKDEFKMSIENARQVYALRQGNKKLLSDLQLKVEELEKAVKRLTQYVPEAVVSEILTVSEDNFLKGERQNATVLFCDIRDFTPLSESFPPEDVVEFLNEFYASLTDVINKHDGSVIQFVGDEIFAAFGTPVAHAHNEQNAVYCALEMLDKVKQLSNQYDEKFGREIAVGIGINCGEVIAGNMGSQARVNYAVLGDAVNTAKRVEGLTKGHTNLILINDCVYERVSHLIEAKAWEPVAVKGKKDLVQTYEVLGRK